MNIELLENAAKRIAKMVQLKLFREEVKVLNANSDDRVEV